MMIRFLCPLLILAGALNDTGYAQPPLESLSDDAMAAVTARDGIAVDLEFRWNASWSGGAVSSIACPTAVQSPFGTPDCRLALQFNDRAGAWLVIKDYFGVLKLNDLLLDARVTPATPSGWCDADCQARAPAGLVTESRPVLALSYGRSGISNDSAYYGDAFFYLNASRITAEFGAQGYLADAISGSTIGLRMADGPDGINGPAQIRFDGQMQIFGY